MQCLMMLIFQRRIIYMGYAPLGSRKEELESDVLENDLLGINVEEIQVNSEEGLPLAGIIVTTRTPRSTSETPNTVVVYLQGNAGNPLHRLPVFQRLLRAPNFHSPIESDSSGIVVVAVAPRSYWKSTSRRPTERGILADYHHVLQYAFERYPSSRIVVYGHSLGGAAAVCLLSQLDESKNPKYRNIQGLILENPFASIPGMIRALYPQRWVPYRYLAPLAFDKWDADGAMRSASTDGSPDTTLKRLSGRLLVLVSENDEIVPPQMGVDLLEAAMIGRNQIEKVHGPRMVVIKGALHENAWDKREWLPEVRRYLDLCR